MPPFLQVMVFMVYRTVEVSRRGYEVGFTALFYILYVLMVYQESNLTFHPLYTTYMTFGFMNGPHSYSQLV
jgi:hypothetical protein